ncbi:MAG: hypothetical protein PWQ20_1584 [Thermotogaceae bacterium]|jgi:LmbE family N-acetylglucosaminyl deacetylase|nr:hypothetical protein [Thermotogaceae bacterium]MDN5338514.1 hypothetical protein [Thermotogaceae bacterium]
MISMDERIIDHIKKILPIPKIEDHKNVLCILPHPDDGEIGAGGTIAKLKSLGAKVRYIMVTDGSAGIRDKSREETREIRKKEQEKAAEILGVDEIIWLNYPDGGEYRIEDVKNDLKKHISLIDPDLIITVDPFLPYEAHPDHKNCGLAVAHVMMLYPKLVPIALFFTAYPNQFVCIDDYWEKKFEAVTAHESQVSGEILELYKGYFELKASVYGEKIGCKYAEAFKVMYPIMFHAFEEALWV